MSSETVEIFWTGGYDSTFRICQLSKKDITIAPYYLSDRRRSESFELEAIKRITDKLRKHTDTRAVLNDICYISPDMRTSDKRISDAFNRVLKKSFMGSQYEWLGVFALDHKGIELCIHKDDKAIEVINREGALKRDENDEKYIIDTDRSSDDIISLFGNLSFPIADLTKLQMKAEYERLGLSDIIDDTWFCHNPSDGKPCGICNPCIYTIEEGMAYRFSEEALKRYKKYRLFIKPFRRVKSHIKHLFL